MYICAIMYNIYTLSNPITGEIRYVGFTSQLLRKRLASHLLEARKDRKKNTYKNNWIRSLLKQEITPKIELIDVIESNLDFWERYWISQFRTWGYNLVNLTGGGRIGRLGLTNSDRHRLAHSKPVYQYTLGGIFVKEFVSQSQAAQELGIGKTTINHAIKYKGNSGGYQWRLEFKPRIPILKNSVLRISIKQYDMRGNFIKSWKGAKEVERQLGIKSANISKVVRGRRKQAGGYLWTYKEL